MVVADGRMSKRQSSYWITQEPRVPRLYGLPKHHKDGVPLRPIVDAIDSVTYKLGKQINHILKPIVDNKPHVLKNSKQFCAAIDNIQLENDELLVSFDVVQLFPSISISAALDALERLLHSNDEWQQRTLLTAREVLILCGMCLNTQEFTYGNQTYIQTEGLPMGGPLSPLVAECVMQDLEGQLFKEFELLEIKPRIWLRMVDDVFSIVKKNEVDNILAVCNSMQPGIKFTVEKEKNGVLPFLDVLVQVTRGGELKKSVYRKPMAALRLLPYSSNHSTSVKVGIVKNLVNRAVNVCSDNSLLNNELNVISTMCEEGGYPPHVFDKAVKQRVGKKSVNQTERLCSGEGKNSQDLPRWGITYHPVLFEIFQRKFRLWGVELVPSNYKTVKKMLPGVKDRTNAQEKKGLFTN